MKRILFISLLVLLFTAPVLNYADESTQTQKMTIEEFNNLQFYKVIAKGVNWMVIEVDGERFLVVL